MVAVKKLVWKKEYTLGIKEIDDQHWMILAYINEIGDHIQRKEPNSVIIAFLDSLIDYMHKHFLLEEEYFKRFDYGGAKQHRYAHAVFMQFLNYTIDMYARTGMLQWDSLVLIFDTLMVHITGFDKLYVECFHDHGLK